MHAAASSLMHAERSGVTVLELLLPPIPALKVLVKLGLGGGGLLLGELFADRLQSLCLLRAFKSSHQP